MRKKKQRTMKLLEMLQVHKRIDVKTIVSTFDISEATARRMCSELEEEGSAFRTHGGIQLAPPIGYDYSFRFSTLRQNMEKVQIGAAACDLVEDQDRIFLDSGTTVMKLAEALSFKIQAGKLRNLIVVTNGLNMVDTLASRCKVILIGGEIRVERRDVSGVVAEKNLYNFRLNKAFIGADGVDLKSGLTATDELTARIAEITIARSDQCYILADSEKFNRKAFVSYAPLKAVKNIITDSKLSPDILSQYQDAFPGLVLPV